MPQQDGARVAKAPDARHDHQECGVDAVDREPVLLNPQSQRVEAERCVGGKAEQGDLRQGPDGPVVEGRPGSVEPRGVGEQDGAQLEEQHQRAGLARAPEGLEPGVGQAGDEDEG